MSIPIIDTLKPMGNFPAVKSKDVDVNGKDLDTVIEEIKHGESDNKNYVDLENKPKVNGVELVGNKTTNELGIEIPTKVSELQNDSDYATKGYVDSHAGTGAVASVKVGNTTYNPVSGVVSIPAYPTTLPASDVKAWAKADSKPSYTASEVGALPASTVIPVKTSQLTNDSGFLTQHQDISGKADRSDVNLLAEKVATTENEQTVLSERMDTFTHLAEGSTTGDAELIDGRIAYDAQEYGNIGAAIRAQKSDTEYKIGAVQNDVTIDIRNQYVAIRSGVPTIVDAGGGAFCTSTVISVPKRSTVLFEAAGYDTNVSMITSCLSDGSGMHDTVMSRSRDVDRYLYYAAKDTYVKLSFNYNKKYKLTILEPKANDSLYNTVNKFALISSNQNITSASFDLNDCEPNKIYLVSNICVNGPINVYGGVLITMARTNTDENLYIQMMIDTSGFIHTRFKQNNGTWTKWRDSLTTDSPVLQSSGSNITSTSFDLNDCQLNKTYLISSNCVNAPYAYGGICYTIALKNDSPHIYPQFFIDINGRFYTRFKKNGGTWTAWSRTLGESECIKTVNDEMTKTYAQLSLFSKIGVIGDSYASGEIYSTTSELIGDIYRISWLQQLARRNGFTGYNFSKGGLTTRSWLTNEKGLSLLNSSDACKLYILALGINDYNSLGESYIGVESDMDITADTYYGNYAKIINAILTKSSNAKIIICKLAIRKDASSATRTLITKYNDAIVNIGSHFGIPVANITEHTYFNSDSYKNLMRGGHPSAVGYSALATAYENVLSETMMQNHDYFEDADFSE